METYDSLQRAYLFGMKNILDEGRLVPSVMDTKSVGSLFGTRTRDYKELQGFGFILSNPRSRIIDTPPRDVSLGFSLANFIWVICGRRDVESISYYNARGRLFSDDGQYYESAFGDRLFGQYNQWRSAKELLGRDLSTRRALLPLYLPEDLRNLPKDTSCASSIQLMVREGKLDLLLHMRSQSAVMVFPYDIFLFSMIQELLSMFLNLPLGRFVYLCNSFHYYMDEETLAREILARNDPHTTEGFEMAQMESISESDISKICVLETEIRSNFRDEKGIPSGVESLPEYWRQIMMVLWSKGLIEHGRGEESVLEGISIVPKELI